MCPASGRPAMIVEIVKGDGAHSGSASRCHDDDVVRRIRHSPVMKQGPDKGAGTGFDVQGPDQGRMMRRVEAARLSGRRALPSAGL